MLTSCPFSLPPPLLLALPPLALLPLVPARMIKKVLACWVCKIYGRCSSQDVDEALQKHGALDKAETFTTRLLCLLRIERSHVPAPLSLLP